VANHIKDVLRLFLSFVICYLYKMVRLLVIWSLVTVVMFSHTSLASIVQSVKPHASKTCNHPLPGKKTPKETSCSEKEIMSFEATELVVQQGFTEPMFRDIVLTPALQQYSFYTLRFSSLHWKPPTFSGLS
jgi:hypothetical protein